MAEKPTPCRAQQQVVLQWLKGVLHCVVEGIECAVMQTHMSEYLGGQLT